MSAPQHVTSVTQSDTPGGDEEPAPTAPTAPPSPRRSRRRLALLVGIPLAVLLALGGGGALTLWWVQSSLDRRIEKFGDPFKAIPAAERPPAPTAAPGPQKAMNLLVLGSDSRISAGDPRQWEAGAQRTDSIILVHVPADRSGAYLVSIPRDTWVEIPGHGKAKINAAFSWGGPALTVRTVEKLTGDRIDHIVVTDFTGFARITDLLGGVKITVPATTGTGNTRVRQAAGTFTMDGATALGYVRERYTLPGGDFDRVKRQQNWIRAIVRKAADAGLAEDPKRLYDVLAETAGSIATDDGFTIGDMRDLALSLRSAGTGSIRFLTVPVQGTAWSSDRQSIVILDQARSGGLWAAVRDDRVAAWLSDSKYPTLGRTVN